MDNRSTAHMRWNCTYHIVFIPKCRRKVMYGETKRDLVEIIKKLCEMKQVELIDGRICKDHIYMYVAVLPQKWKICNMKAIWRDRAYNNYWHADEFRTDGLRRRNTFTYSKQRYTEIFES